MLEVLYYLHSNAIAHCDLKTEKIVLDQNFDTKLIDFGSATSFAENVS